MLCLLWTDCSNVKGMIPTIKARGVTQTQRPLQLLVIELNSHCVGNILVDIITPYDRVWKCNFTRKYQQSTLLQNVFSEQNASYFGGPPYEYLSSVLRGEFHNLHIRTHWFYRRRSILLKTTATCRVLYVRSRNLRRLSNNDQYCISCVYHLAIKFANCIVRWIVHYEFVPTGQRVNQVYYLEVLKRLHGKS